jgi:hypothetical protein
MAAFRGKTEEQQQPQAHKVAVAGPYTMEPRDPTGLPQHETADNRSVSSGPKCKQLVSGQNVENSSNGITADYDSLMMLC